jgi:hypothetical protein
MLRPLPIINFILPGGGGVQWGGGLRGRGQGQRDKWECSMMVQQWITTAPGGRWGRWKQKQGLGGQFRQYLQAVASTWCEQRRTLFGALNHSGQEQRVAIAEDACRAQRGGGHVTHAVGSQRELLSLYLGLSVVVQGLGGIGERLVHVVAVLALEHH